MDDEALHILIAQNLQNGRLPRDRPARVYGCPGNGEICAACGSAVPKAQMLIEIERTVLQDGTVTKLHARCFQILESERQKLA